MRSPALSFHDERFGARAGASPTRAHYVPFAMTLARFLEDEKETLLRRAGDERDDTEAPPGTSLSALLGDLTAAARHGRVDVGMDRPRCWLGTKIDLLLAELAALRGAFYALVEERAPSLAVRELGLVTEWFSAMTELALREQNRMLTILVDTVPDHLALHDSQNRILFSNRAAREDVAMALGEPGRDPVGHELGEIAGMEDYAEQMDRDFMRARFGQVATSEIRFPSRDGWHWREQTVSPVFDAEGGVKAVAIVSRNVHGRRTADDRLRLMSKLTAAADRLDREGILNAVARVAVPELADWAIVRRIGDGSDGRRPALAGEALERLRGGHSIFHATAAPAELRALGVPGELRDAASVILVPLLVLGELAAVATFVTTGASRRRYGADDLAVAEELTGRASQLIENARLHERVLESEARFRIGLARSAITVFEEDAEGRVRWIYNPQYGGREEDIVGTRLDEKLSPENASTLAAAKRHVLETGERAHLELDAVLGGERRYVLMSFEALRGPGDVVVGMAGSVVDMTEARLAQEQLAHALGFRDRMMGILGHDLRNPAAAIQGIAGLLMLDGALSENVRNGLQRIDQSARRMAEMIGTVLDFTRTRFRGSIPVVRQKMDMQELTRAIVDELAVGYPNREITFDASGDQRGEWDRARIAQVVSNLVGNALIHGSSGTPVGVTLSADEESIVLRVSNRGRDIPSEELERLFEPFEQGGAGGGLESADGARPRAVHRAPDRAVARRDHRAQLGARHDYVRGLSAALSGCSGR